MRFLLCFLLCFLFGDPVEPFGVVSCERGHFLRHFPPEDREKIFDRFFTADRAHTAGKGTGLGLSICKRIMDMHGQSIRLLDTEEGAAFRFTLKTAEK